MSLMELTGGFAGFLNNGRRTKPYGWIDLRLRGDEMLMAADREEGFRVINSQAAGELVWMLWQVVERGSGRRAAIEGWQVAGKTGTTQSARDAWFIGFTTEFVAGVWMGYDDNTPLTGVPGAPLPAEIWHETMVQLHDGLVPRPLPMIEPVPPVAFDAPEPVRGGNPIDNLLRDLFGR